MGLAKSYSAQLIGLKMELVTIEVDISHGLHHFSVVGLGDRSVDEARDRISAAIKNSNYISPKQKNQKVVISLAPADVRKEGAQFDLAMAITYLSACKEIDFDSDKILILGELSLEGRVRRVHGILPILCQAAKLGFSQAIIPVENTEEASLAKTIICYGANSLKEVIDHIKGLKILEKIQIRESLAGLSVKKNNFVDIKSVRGNVIAKRGLEIAAAGAHNVLMYGPPGTGKTMLAKSFAGLLPQLSYDESVEVTGIHSAAHTLNGGLIVDPPIRMPHHTASYASVVGGGSYPRPGEITLAHRGVLFLDEFPEFDRSVLEALRQPLEDREITISRAKGIVAFPAQCILIASMNPCPCGRGRDRNCQCTGAMIQVYKRKISGPIMDRIDIWLNINHIDYESLAASKNQAESSADIQKRVIAARQIQFDRFQRNKTNKKYNSELSAGDIEQFIKIEPIARQILKDFAIKSKMSGRTFHRLIKIAQTLADLRQLDRITDNCIYEALQFRKRNQS